MGARHFLMETHAGATSIMAAFIVVMAVGGAALVTDHVWLVDQRDALKRASDAAAVAATLGMRRVLASNPNVSDAELRAAITPEARNYVLANLLHLSGERRRKAVDSLTMDVRPDQTQGTVSVSVSADLGGFLFAGRLPFLGGVEAIDSTRAVSGVESANAPVEVVLAIDTSNSMAFTLGGGAATTDSRMQIVQRAANDMVRILGPNTRDPVAVGVVPWSHTACVDQDECDRNDGQIALPPSTDPGTVSQAIHHLVANGRGTRSTFGLTVGKDFLDTAPDEHRKVLVLLTDGEDNACLKPNGRTRNCPAAAARLEQADACTAAKNAGIEIFVIAAMEPALVSGPHGDGLRDCSSDGDSPGEHVFLNNATAENLRAAFVDIANQLVLVRRVY